MDHRQHPRFPVQFHSSFSSANIVAGEGTLTDLSIRGCRISSLADVKAGTTLRVRITVSDNEPPIEVHQAVARWSRDHSFGLEFLTLFPGEWAKLQHVVRQLELEPYQRTDHAQSAVG